MKTRQLRLTTSLIVLIPSFFLCSCLNNTSAGLQESVIGDYLFDREDINFVGLMTVYEEDDTLYALLEMTDDPVVMTLKDPERYVFQVEYEESGPYELMFADKDDGNFTRVTIRGERNDLVMEGTRCDPGVTALREVYATPPTPYVYRHPPVLDDDWDVSTLQDEGIDTVRIYDFMNAVLDSYDYVHSILIVKNGMLVLEEYLNGWDPVRLHRVQSVTKSVTSTLVGLAVREGIIENVGTPLHTYLPEYASLFDEAKRRISVEHLLTMSAGIEWNEAATYYTDPANSDPHLADASGDYIRYVLEKPLAEEPGRRYCYNSGYPNILGHIIEAGSGMSITRFARTHLFGPIGIRRSYWSANKGENRPGCAGGLRLTSRDLARYGYLYLRDGEWEGKQIVPKEWVRRSTEGIMNSGMGTRYGYWWKSIPTLDGKHLIHFASGTGGQYVIFIPDLDVVIVTTAKPFTDKSDHLAAFLLQKLMPAL